MNHDVSGKLVVFCALLSFLSDIRITTGAVVSTKAPPIPPETLYFVISAKNLPGKDTNKKLDPYVKVFLGEGPIKAYVTGLPNGLKKIARTDILKNNINPEWYRVFTVQWTPGRNQSIYMEIIDDDLLVADDIVGYAAFDLDEYVRRGQEIIANLNMASYIPFYSSNGKPEVSIRKTETFAFQLAAKNLPKMDEFGTRSDPFVECFYRKGREGKDLKFFTTQIINNEENPSWGTIKFTHYQSSEDQWFYFKVMDHDAVTPNDLMGDLLTPVLQFVNASEPKSFVMDDIDKSVLVVTFLNFV